MATRKMWIPAVMLVLSSTALAHPGSGWGRDQDHRELSQDRREQWDDRRDLQQLESLLAKLDRGRMLRDRRLLDAVDRELADFIRSEYSEARFEAAKARMEVRRSGAEIRDERREVFTSGVYGRPASYMGNRHDLRDDRRDFHDDLRDARREHAFLRRTREIGMRLDPLYGWHDRFSTMRKRQLLGELIVLARQEIASNFEESREDRRELREDWREARREFR